MELADQDGEVIGSFGLSMVKTPPCAVCGEHKALMYGFWPTSKRKSKTLRKPVVAVCNFHLWGGGRQFGGLLTAVEQWYSQRRKRK